MRIALLGLAVLSLALAALMLSGVCLRQDEFTSENTSHSVRTTQAALPQLDAENLQDLVRHKGQQVSVKGKVHSTHLANSHKVFTLNLGPDWRTCFKVAIFQDAFGKWDDGVSGIKSMYEGQTVTVEGELGMYRDSPQIIVRVPSQIQVMK
jgi:hypothetical protein